MLDETSAAILPALYARWLQSLLDGPIPAETRATCADCAMLPARDASTPGADQGVFYNPALKCCSYVPQLHNFLTGQILGDDAPETLPGRRTVEARIGSGIGVTPLGLEPPADYALLYRHGAPAFGRSRAMRCPHYLDDGGSCGIWKYRESTCSTWFCKHRRGAVGLSFWRDNLHPLLASIERSLALWCVVELGFDVEQLRSILIARTGEDEPLHAEQLDHRVDWDAHQRLWRDWSGREAEWYRACSEKVSGLDWQQVLAICGPDVGALASLTRQAYRRLLDTRLPACLEPGAFELVQIRTDYARVASYSPLDPVDLPPAILNLLHYFHDRTVEAALQAIRERENITLSEDLIAKLADFGVLRPAGDVVP